MLKTSSRSILSVFLTTCLVITAFWFPLSEVKAAASNTMSNLSAGAVSNHSFVFDSPVTINDGDSVVITFPVGFVFADNPLINRLTLEVGGAPQTLVTAAPAPGQWVAAIDDDARTISFTASANNSISNGQSVEVFVQSVDWDTITNPVAPGKYDIEIATNSVADGDVITTVSVIILDDSQVLIDGVVDNTLSFSLGENNISFGDLNSSGARFATAGGGSNDSTVAHTYIIGTNAASGYTVALSGTTLASGFINTIDAIGGVSALSDPGVEQFGLRVAINANPSANAAVEGAFSQNDQFAFDSGAPNTLSNVNTPAANTTYDVYYIANVSTLTEAGNYSTALTYVATANF